MRRIFRATLIGCGVAATAVPLLYLGRRWIEPMVDINGTWLLLQAGGRRLGEVASAGGWMLTAALQQARRVGQGEKMRAIWDLIPRVARTNATIMIRGESGVGKEVVARAIHQASERSERQFLKVNCAAIPGELLESELFGHERGAFTGAYRRKPGKFEAAHRGTLMLDEVGEIPYSLQAKLLHVLQDGEFSPVGSARSIATDVQVIAATNRDLEAAIRERQFREDLYYRLNVIEIRVPSLRERRDEIPGLVEHFLATFNQEYGRAVGIPADTMRLFLTYDWPGNIRELENTVRRIVVLGGAQSVHDAIETRGAEGIPAPPATNSQANGHGHGHTNGVSSTIATTVVPTQVLGLRDIARRAARDAESAVIKNTLDRVRWNRAKAAALLGISYKSLLNKISAYGLDKT